MIHKFTGWDQDQLAKVLKRPIFQNGTSVLQVGARTGGSWIKVFRHFEDIGYNHFDVLEIFPKNVERLKWENLNKKMCGDVRNIDKIEGSQTSYDVIIWWHGPEHVTKKDFEKTLPKLLAKSKIGVIVGMPNGKWEQGKIYGNKWEEHISTWKPKDLEKLGAEVWERSRVMFGIFWNE